MSHRNKGYFDAVSSRGKQKLSGTDEGSPIVYIRPQFIHIHLTDLGESEQLVLWTMRVWVRGFMQDLPVQQYISNRLNLPNGHEIVDEIDTLMSLFGSSSRQQLDIRCPMCLPLSPDEYTFLLLIGSAQAGTGDLVKAITEESLSPPAPKYGALIAERLSTHLRASGLELSASPAPFNLEDPNASQPLQQQARLDP